LEDNPWWFRELGLWINFIASALLRIRGDTAWTKGLSPAADKQRAHSSNDEQWACEVSPIVESVSLAAKGLEMEWSNVLFDNAAKMKSATAAAGAAN